MRARACMCFKENMTHSSKKVTPPKTSGKPAFPVFSRGGAVGSLCSQESRNKKKMGRWKVGVGVGRETKPSQNLHPLCMNEMVGGEAAKCSRGVGEVRQRVAEIRRRGTGLCEAGGTLSCL